MTILVTGFTPFDNRTINSSWIAATSTTDSIQLEIPVVWGQPGVYLEDAVNQHEPNIIISMGEGREGWFDIETVAKNVRNHRLDNKGQFPTGPILKNGCERRSASIRAKQLHSRLSSEEIPIRISEDAGGFICEETLYMLETMRSENRSIETVVFVHLPPYGTPLLYRNEPRICDSAVLSDFSNHLMTNVKLINREDSEAGD